MPDLLRPNSGAKPNQLVTVASRPPRRGELTLETETKCLRAAVTYRYARAFIEQMRTDAKTGTADEQY
jgi:hypothetical protein